MDWKLELVPIPVADVDAAKRFYIEKLGFRPDHDVTTGPQFRVVQLTPPGSACSICSTRLVSRSGGDTARLPSS